MKLRRLLWIAPVAGAIGLGLAADRFLVAAPNQQDAADPKPAAALPVSQVVLFNSGVGYFARAGEVEGEARVDLSFPEDDINDLIKSMTLQDFDGGRIAAVSYESREPVARTLSSFAVNLNNNPSLTQILMQVRGEKVEIALQPTAQAQPGTMTGTVVGVDKVRLPVGNNQVSDCDVLNLLTADGVRAIKLMDVLRIKFTNPVLEAEIKRALEVLALAHDAQKKSVSIHFAGDGRRKVKVGYVVEAPIWKTSYRLVLDKDGQPYLQGWAVVENVTDEDWSGVKMALVSGRPISFKMDLYNPLYVPRPTVEPELFASLRPPTYQGSFNEAEKRAGQGVEARQNEALGRMLRARPEGGIGATGGFARDPEKAVDARLELKASNRAEARAELEYARRLGKEMAERMGGMGAVQSAATASALGDYYQYIIDHPVSLQRQKSALLPIISKDVEGTRLSIYNQAVQPKHPLLGLRFKNTTGANLAQGPITLYEGSTYAGDSRILDVQPNEERLIAYAIDLGTEVKVDVGDNTSRVTAVRANKGVIITTSKQIEERIYKAVNRSEQDRTLLIEHPNRTNQQFKLVDTAKPTEETADLWRFQMPMPAGKTVEFKVREEKEFPTEYQLTNTPENQIRFFVSLNETSPELKEKLQEALALKGKWDVQQRELQQVIEDLKRITADQDRIRKNLRETPREAAVYETYLKKLSDQEKELDTLTAKQKELMKAEFDAKKGYEDFLGSLTG